MLLALVAALGMSSFAAPCRAQSDDVDPPAATAAALTRWTVQVDPLTLALGYVHVQIEQRIVDHVSIYVGPHMRLFSTPFLEPSPYLGFGLEAGVRIYPFGTAPDGWWVLGRGVAAYLVTLDYSAAPRVGGYVSALVGYTFILFDHLVISLGAGAQYIDYKIGAYGPRGLFPALHTAVGFAF